MGAFPPKEPLVQHRCRFNIFGNLVRSCEPSANQLAFPPEMNCSYCETVLCQLVALMYLNSKYSKGGGLQQASFSYQITFSL